MGDWLIDEEAELLGETLSLLASWDGEDPSSIERDEAPRKNDLTATRTAAKTAMCRRSENQQSKERSSSSISRDGGAVKAAAVARPGRINATRERRRQEIRLLQSESAQLQQQLNALQQRRKEMLRPHYRGWAIQSTVPVWENLARRQFQSRRRTEAYNAKLRQEIQVQTQVAEQLMSAVQFALQRQLLQDRRPKAQRPMDVSQHLSEDEQLERLNYNLPRLEWALSLSPKFGRGDLEFLDINVVSADGCSATVELCHSHVLPYAVDVVGDLLHSFFQAVSSDPDGDDEDVDKNIHELDSGNELVVAAFNVESRMGRGTIGGKWVGKHSSTHGGGQRLICDQWHYQMTGFGNELDGVSVVEDAWQRLVDAKDISHTQFNGPVTVMQLVRRLQLTFNRSERVNQSHAKTVAAMFEENAAGKIRHATENVENILMDQAKELAPSN